MQAIEDMNPMQAIQLIDQAIAAFHGNREDHAKLAQALNVIKTIVLPEPKKPPTPVKSTRGKTTAKPKDDDKK